MPKHLFKIALFTLSLLLLSSPGIQAQKKKKQKKNYKAIEVTFQNDSITLAGTLTLPKGKGPFPAVVLVSGSGPQDRNEDIMGFRPFEILAHRLSNEGIAVLRYDDRGFAKSTGPGVMESTSFDLAEDAVAAVACVRKQERIDPKRIAVMGHSEGGLIAPMVAAEDPDLAGIVLMAGPGVTGLEILREQNKLIFAAMGEDEETIAWQLENLDLFHKALTKDGDWDEIRQRLGKKFGEQYDAKTTDEQALMGDRDAFIKSMVDPMISQVNNPWFAAFMDIDPVGFLTRTKCPVLSLWGAKDLQVPPEQSKGPMKAALERGANPAYKSITYPEANHLFQDADTGSPVEYAMLKKEFVDGFLDDVADWLKMTLKAGN